MLESGATPMEIVAPRQKIFSRAAIALHTRLKEGTPQRSA
jgi:hypothetical protein